MKTIWATATLIVGGIGAWYVFSPDEETAPLPANNIKSTEQTKTLSDLIAQMAPREAPSKTQAESTPVQPEQTAKDCIGNFFYTRSKTAHATTDQKFSNLRWAAEMYGNTINAESLDKAAKSLSVDKAKFVTELREAAQAVFWQTPTYNLQTNWDKLNYWNNQKLAHEFTGISNEGEFNNAVAIAATQTTVETIRSNRDSFALNALKEIMPTLKATLEAINKGDQNRDLNSSISDPLEKLSPAQQIEFRQHIELADYVINTLLKSDKNAISSLGLSQELYDVMKDISRSSRLDFLISDQFAIECKMAPAPEQHPK